MPDTADTIPAPSLRLRQRPVEKIRLPAAKLARLVAPESLLRSAAEGEFVELNADRILSHIVPHVSLAHLADASPDLFSSSQEIVRLPASLLAAAYKIEEEPCEEDARFFSSSNPPPPHLPSPVCHLSRLAPQACDAPPEESHSEPIAIEPIAIEPIAIEPIAIEPIAIEPIAPEAAPQADPNAAADQPHRLLELIQRLPTFHRFSPSESAPLLLEIEPCSDGADLPDQDALQALFLTEEKLTVRRVVEICGTLPGIRSCVLTHGDLVVSAHNVPEGLDLVSMSATAAKMLDAMQDSAAQLGLGQVPALTLHTERGPLSIVRQGGLAMLVVHADRGFIPGVREKLAAALGELSRAPLALPRPATLDQ